MLTKHLQVDAASWQKATPARLGCMVGVWHLKLRNTVIRGP